MEPEILFETKGGAGIVTFNRPQALNALNHGMVREMDRQLGLWARDPAIKAVIVTGAGARAFCAGGDIKAAAQAVREGGAARREAAEFFRAEYTLNHSIFTFPKPYVSLIEGIVMGGGVGVSAHGSHRVALGAITFAMPEAMIGFFPDVGGGYFLPRCPGQTGVYLALTGGRIGTADAAYIGFATHHAPAASRAALQEALVERPGEVDAVLAAFSAPIEGAGVLAPLRARIDACFSHDRVEDILAALQADGTDWAQQTLATLRAASPSTLKIALRQMRLGATLDFAGVMTMEYRLSQACLDRPDFCEGVRAAVIDKDRNPRWSPPRVEDVTDAEVAACFQPLGAGDLVLE